MNHKPDDERASRYAYYAHVVDGFTRAGAPVREDLGMDDDEELIEWVRDANEALLSAEGGLIRSEPPVHREYTPYDPSWN